MVGRRASAVASPRELARLARRDGILRLRATIERGNAPALALVRGWRSSRAGRKEAPWRSSSASARDRQCAGAHHRGRPQGSHQTYAPKGLNISAHGHRVREAAFNLIGPVTMRPCSTSTRAGRGM